jgi:hypothetical protein
LNKKRLGQSIIILALFISIIGFYSFFLTNNQTIIENISPLNEMKIPLKLGYEDKLNGNLIIREENKGIKVYLEDPYGELIYDGGIVFSTLEFVINSKKEGTHNLTLTNLDPSQQQEIQIQITKNQISWSLSFIITLSGIILSVIGYFYFYKNRFH